MADLPKKFLPEHGGGSIRKWQKSKKTSNPSNCRAQSLSGGQCWWLHYSSVHESSVEVALNQTGPKFTTAMRLMSSYQNNLVAAAKDGNDGYEVQEVEPFNPADVGIGYPYSPVKLNYHSELYSVFAQLEYVSC